MANVVAIAGGGASGVFLAAHVLRESPDTRVLIFEPGALGLGIAYATTCPAHLLNVAAKGMSLFADDPADFVSWLERNCPGVYTSESFVPRHIYGKYLQGVARDLALSYSHRFEHVRELLVSVDATGAALMLRSSEGGTYDADVLVVATGHPQTATWPGAPESPRYHPDPWRDGALVAGNPDETVLILGTGLTAIDAVLSLRHNEHRGRIYLVSRRGAFPHEHRPFTTIPSPPPQARSIADVLAALRAGAQWRSSVDALRPFTNDVWTSFPLTERKRFLRHAASYWNVHRHRMAPEVAATLAELLASGAIVKIAGHTTSFEDSNGSLRVAIRERSGRECTIVAQRVINCGGMSYDVSKQRNPLICSLADRGLLAPNALGVGVDVAPDGALVGSDGRASERIYSIGPVRFGALIETTAVPEIRSQAAALSRTLAIRAATAYPNRAR
jgi:uncharacterized NAD(P)/FAD-binding protein YdhS